MQTKCGIKKTHAINQLQNFVTLLPFEVVTSSASSKMFLDTSSNI